MSRIREIATLTDVQERRRARRARRAGQAAHYATDQFNSPYTVAGMRDSVGRETWEQTGGRIAAFVQGVGTASSVIGVSQALKAERADIRVVALEPAGSPAISGGEARGTFAMQGWSGSVPPHWDPSAVDDVWTVADDEALAMARRLAAEEGIFAGTSSGANVVGALRLAEQLRPGDVVVTLAVDGFKYMTGSPYG